MRTEKWLNDLFKQEIPQDDVISYALTHGGFIEDCNGNACCDETPVMFLYKGDNSVSNGVLRWSDERKMFTILTSNGIFIYIDSTKWFKKRG